MFRLIKRLFCKHDYHLLGTFEKDIIDGLGYEVKDIHVIYCPKCAKKREVFDYEYNIIMEQQKIDNQYKHKKEI